MSLKVVLTSDLPGGPAKTIRSPIAAIAYLLTVLLTFHNTVFAADKAEPSDNIKDLKRQRLVLLEKIHKNTMGRFEVDPTTTLDQVQQTRVVLFAARLDLAETKEERIKVCEDAVKDAEAWEKIIAKSVKDGGLSPSDGFKAQAYVLETRIALVKAKGEK